MTIEELAANIDKIDRHYASELKKVDEFYGKKVDVLIDQIKSLREHTGDLAARVSKLEKSK
ncbi:MAG TPA: hypothetical protein VHL58_06280 [Thermoanaerobaculia bacterium]|nr:hypothetical protein [Thermoanaerobaculia bacterium]